MSSAEEMTRAIALVDQLFGPSDDAADRAVAIIDAHAAALAWVRDTTGTYPAPETVADALNEVAERLRRGSDTRDPVTALGQTAVDALAAHRAVAGT